jgi:hypothetical protein
MRNAEQAKGPCELHSIEETLTDQGIYGVGGDGFEPPTPAL